MQQPAPNKRHANLQVVGTASLTVAAAAILCAVGCAVWGTDPSQPMTVVRVVEMSKAGVPVDAIIRQLKLFGTADRLKAGQLAQLVDSGVAAPVVDCLR